ncbi:MAG: L-threonylcarbamoyladenylate synthase [Phycisphaerales bacterium]
MTDFSHISRATDFLRRGGVVAFPTETVYGLGADALSPEAIERVFLLKGRPRNNPLIVHVSGPEMARTVARDWPESAERLAAEFWPGPLSMLLPRRSSLPEAVTAGSDLVAVRCPNHPLALALIFEFAGPIVGPSANPSGAVSPTTAAHVLEAFANRDVLVLDGGACPAGIESTVIDLSTRPARILRPGVIGPEQISRAMDMEVASPAAPESPTDPQCDLPLHSPGRLERHYAPRTPARLFETHQWPAVLTSAPRAAVLTYTALRVQPPHMAVELPADPAGYAAALYAALRDADRSGAAVILIQRPPESGDPIWLAVADRLRRATS